MSSDELFSTIERHETDGLAELLRGGANANALQHGPPFWRPLHAAIEELEHGAGIDTLVLLLRAGADPDGWDGDHDAPPLLMACFRRQHDAVRLLLAAGANPDVVGKEGDTPLLWWAGLGDTEMVGLLLRVGAAPDRPGGLQGMTPLGTAAHRLDLPMLRLLLTHGADPRALDADRRTARDCLPARSPQLAREWDTAASLLG